LVRDFAEYHTNYTFKDGVFVAELRLLVKQSEIPLSALKDYQSFQKAVSDDQNQYTELLSGPQALFVPSPSANAEATNLVEEAREALQRRDIDGASDAVQRALKLDGQYKDAWSMLGAVRLAQGRTNEGLTALRKAIEVDPKDTRTYKVLGFAYMGMRRPEEAVPVWRDLLKQDPNDRDAHANLGNVLLSLKRYGEAVPELEAAVALNKPSPWLSMALANAYLGAGNNDKAVATLSKTAETALDPRIWNEEVKFISGAEHIRPLSKVLASLKLKAPLPDEAPVKLVRRGVLVCEGGWPRLRFHSVYNRFGTFDGVTFGNVATRRAVSTAGKTSPTKNI
jgi:tetratricopeptide (TPR) repeat protein